jgi:hypothetical protein
VRDACRRHLEDLKRRRGARLRWDLESGERAIGFFRDVLRLNGGEYEGQAYELLPWQASSSAASSDGRRLTARGAFASRTSRRRKGSGKSPLAAGVGLYGLVADGERAPRSTRRRRRKTRRKFSFAMPSRWSISRRRSREGSRKSGVGENVWNLAYRSKR